MYLSAAGSILGRTSGNELSIVVLDQVLVEAHVLLLGQDGIVGLQSVLLEQLLVSKGLLVSNCPRSLFDFRDQSPSRPISRNHHRP